MTPRRILLANASFSVGSAVVILAARDTLFPLFALESGGLLVAIAGGLLIYAGSLAVAARRQPPDRRALLTAAVLDAAWVVGSVMLLVAAWTQLAPTARVLIVAAALIVEVFATIQFRAARPILPERGR